MHIISQKIPDISLAVTKKTRDELVRKLEALENIFSSAAAVKVGSHLKLNTDDMESICRIYKTIEVVVKDDLVDIQVDARKTIENLTNSPYWDTILRPYTVLLATDGLSYSSWHSITQIHEPRFSCLTSPFMLAARERHGVPYQYWKRGISPNEWFFLFEKNVVKAFTSPTSPTKTQWDKIKPNGEMYQHVLKDPTNPLGYFLAPTPNLYDEIEDDEGGPKLLWEGFNKWPRLVQHMKLQTWICHPSARDENSMILNPFNWDYVPPMNANAPVFTRDNGGTRVEPSKYMSLLEKGKKTKHDDGLV